MVKKSSIYKLIILVCVAVMLGLHMMTPTEIIGVNTVKLLIAILGVILGVCSYFDIQRSSAARKYFVILRKYLRTYIFVVLFECFYTMIAYDYSISEIMIAVTPYLFAFFALPLVYIFTVDGNCYYFLKKLCLLVALFLGIKAFAWFLYNFRGITLFERWIFEFKEWTRDGLLRVNAGYFTGITIIISAYLGFRKNGKLIYKAIVVGMILFLNFLTKMRFLLAVSLVAVFLILYTSADKKNIRIVRQLGLLMIVLFILSSDYFYQFISSFSISGDLGWSTMARFLTIEHYWEIMKDRNAIFGLGFLITDNNNAARLLGTGVRYYLEDVGIFGGFFRFGVFSIFIYGQLFYYVIKTCLVSYRNKVITIWPMIFSLSAYMLLSCLILNFYDIQRAFDVPFYLAIISYIYGCHLNKNERPNLVLNKKEYSQV